MILGNLGRDRSPPVGNFTGKLQQKKGWAVLSDEQMSNG